MENRFLVNLHIIHQLVKDMDEGNFRSSMRNQDMVLSCFTDLYNQYIKTVGLSVDITDDAILVIAETGSELADVVAQFHYVGAYDRAMEQALDLIQHIKTPVVSK